MTERRIGILGGSFNPPHTGHLKVANAARTQLNLDEVWLLVSPQNPLKSPSEMAPFKHRLQMCKLLAQGHSWLKPSDFELTAHTRFTADTVKKLKKVLPDATLFWLMGADNLEQLHHWKDWQHLVQTIPIAIFKRPGTQHNGKKSVAAKHMHKWLVDVNTPETTPPNWRFLSHLEINVSATHIRAHKPGSHAYLTQPVADYIKLKNLYPNPII